MTFWKTLASLKRAELSFLLFAAFFALCVLPSGAGGATLAPQSAGAVLFLLSSESVLLETAPVAAQSAAPPARKANNPVVITRDLAPQTPTHRAPEAHIAALLSGVRTNRRLI